MDTLQSTGPLQILLIEDCAGESCLLRMGMEEAGLEFDLHTIDRGEAALAYLGKAADFGAYPDLILLDLHLPGMSGQEVLAAIRADPRLGHVPVAVCTWSENPQDKLSVVQLGANGFIRKPDTLADYLKVGESVRELWYGVLAPGRSHREAASGGAA